jgi:branched-chain amino acid transport system substrate-binding protein
MKTNIGRKALCIFLMGTILLALCGVSMADAEEITMGVLVDLSGPLTTYGRDISNSLTIAAEDINNYFVEEGLDYEVTLYVEDTKVDPKVALDKVMALHGKGVELMVGPMGSGEVKNVLGYVTANKIIVISPSSTAAPEMIGITKPDEKKYALRFVALDSFQTKAIAKEISELEIKAVCIAYIGNAWGKGLKDYGISELEKYRIEVADPVEYPDPPPADFSPYIATIERQLNEFNEHYDWNEIAVVTFSYEEAYTMLSQVEEGSSMLNVIWVGCDGNVHSEKISEICDKANKVKYYSTIFESKGEAFDKLNETMIERFERAPHQYGMNAYDAAWVLALAYTEVYDTFGEYNADEMAKIIPEVTTNYSEGDYGVGTVSGYVELDEFNDRASGDYAIYTVKDCRWDKAAVWSYETGYIDWLVSPPSPALTSALTPTPTPTPAPSPGKEVIEDYEKTPVPTPTPPGFEAPLAAIGMITVAYLLRRRCS